MTREGLPPCRRGGVRFAQCGLSSTFRHGEFVGRTIDDVAAGLRSGAINPNQLPIQTITRDGVTTSATTGSPGGGQWNEGGKIRQNSSSFSPMKKVPPNSQILGGDVTNDEAEGLGGGFFAFGMGNFVLHTINDEVHVGANPHATDQPLDYISGESTTELRAYGRDDSNG